MELYILKSTEARPNLIKMQQEANLIKSAKKIDLSNACAIRINVGPEPNLD